MEDHRQMLGDLLAQSLKASHRRLAVGPGVVQHPVEPLPHDHRAGCAPEAARSARGRTRRGVSRCSSHASRRATRSRSQRRISIRPRGVRSARHRQPAALAERGGLEPESERSEVRLAVASVSFRSASPHRARRGSFPSPSSAIRIQESATRPADRDRRHCAHPHQCCCRPGRRRPPGRRSRCRAVTPSAAAPTGSQPMRAHAASPPRA